MANRRENKKLEKRRRGPKGEEIYTGAGAAVQEKVSNFWIWQPGDGFLTSVFGRKSPLIKSKKLKIAEDF